MRIKSKVILVCLMAVIFAFAGSGAWATPDCTWSRSVGSGTYTGKVAVAANFYATMKDLVQKCQTDGYCPNTNITVCSDSTGNFKTALDADYTANGSFTLYDFFLSADETAAGYNGYTGVVDSAYLYAKGTPVLFSYTSILTDTTHLVTQASGTDYTITASANGLRNYTINTSAVGTLAIANDQAPYGQKAATIINAMQPSYSASPQCLLFGCTPAYVHAPYSSVGNAFNGVGTTGVNAGFVSKGQICNGSGGVNAATYVYVAFTHSTMKLLQKAIQLNSAQAATDLQGYINYMMTTNTPSLWSAYMADRCYEY